MRSLLRKCRKLRYHRLTMENEWVVIAGFTDDVKSQIAVERLLTSGIDAVAVDKRDSIYKIGEIEVFVHRDSVLIAKEIIKDL